MVLRIAGLVFVFAMVVAAAVAAQWFIDNWSG